MSSRRFAGGGGGSSNPSVGKSQRYVWTANGNLSLYSTSVAAPTGGGGPAFFDGAYVMTVAQTISQVVMTQRETGPSGFTNVELFRVRAGVYTSLGVFGNFGQVPASLVTTYTTPGAFGVLGSLLQDDVLMVRFTEVQTAGATVPMDVVFEVRTV